MKGEKAGMKSQRHSCGPCVDQLSAWHRSQSFLNVAVVPSPSIRVAERKPSSDLLFQLGSI